MGGNPPGRKTTNFNILIMEKLYKYRFLMSHDKGQFYLSVVAGSLNRAKMLIMKAENCPERAMEIISKNKINI